MSTGNAQGLSGSRDQDMEDVSANAANTHWIWVLARYEEYGGSACPGDGVGGLFVVSESDLAGSVFYAAVADGVVAAFGY